jgi:2-iminobutanoate/2-iminopropanoate deaminase
VSRPEPVRTDRAPAPVAGAPYSQAIVAPAGRTVYVSGQVPLDPATGALAGADIATQTRRALQNVAAVLEAAGASLADVVRTTVYMTDLSEFGTMNAVYAEAFGDHAPARATVGVAALPAGARVEIDAIAVIA